MAYGGEASMTAGERTGRKGRSTARGALQLTGKNRYKAFSQYANDPGILTDPSAVAKQYSFNSALFFLDKKDLWPIYEQGFSRETIKKLTRKINGGLNGIDHRITLTEKYSKYEL